MGWVVGGRDPERGPVRGGAGAGIPSPKRVLRHLSGFSGVGAGIPPGSASSGRSGRTLNAGPPTVRWGVVGGLAR
ncbi:protein of unknown function [Streptantibioticus cattleyicolor NRRL 8057 = DSM 46488]|nr:protein of unknown function [Streptantibioticus cattleyicolor NRRL 8057 = DSM 46488]